MSRVLTVAAGLIAAVLFALLMTGLRDEPLLRVAFMPAILVLVLWRAIPEMLLGPADPALPPAASARARATTPGFVGGRRTRLTVSVHPDRIVVGLPFLGRRTIMADQLTGVTVEPSGAVRVDHVAGTLRSAPIRLPLPAGSPLHDALTWFAANRPALPAPTRAPGWWTFLRVWGLVAGVEGVAIGVYLVVRGDQFGVMAILASIVAGSVVWTMAAGRWPLSWSTAGR
ncbi:hypothetical protein [Actinophytocola sp. KF-1]